MISPMKTIPPKLKWLFVAVFFLSACQPAAQSQQAPAGGTVEFPLPTVIVTPTEPRIDPTPTLPVPTPLPTAIAFCPPLEGFSLSQIENSIVNSFNPPPPGSDDPHQGIDIADLIQNSQVAIAGRPVFAITEGQTALVIADRFPYGVAILVETPLDSLPEDWIEQLQLQGLAENFTPNTALTCPQELEAPAWKAKPNQSLYILYAHLQNPAGIELGDPISCGQQLGEIGETGNALNPHLHIEMRVGPSGARFESMAHYDASASVAEMNAYCTWRISGLFRLIDPLELLRIALG